MNSHPSSSERSTAFDLLADPVRRWIWRKGWSSLHDIQEKSIPILLNRDNDLIIAAATAGGKTEAAFLPLISSVLKHPGSGGFDLVYVGPLRALINDQFERLEDLCAKTELPVYPWHGDIGRGVKARARKTPRGVLLITPESLEALFVLRGLEIRGLFNCTRAIVVDELHALLDNERGIHLRSLLTRVEIAVDRRIRRIGLSATLGEMELARKYLRPEASEAVELLESDSEGPELKVQIRGYLRRQRRTAGNESSEDESAAQRAVASHLFARLRGNRNLVFAGSRQNVEWYADALREASEKARVPLEFFPHHANLTREHRIDLEKRLKTRSAATAVCTSTLELGIDIGAIRCVAQVGAPFSVASLRQRLGRSGRRRGEAAVLRMYAIETETGPDSHPLDRLYLELIRSIAMVELLIEKWCEPPAPQALHLSTLTHQILSVIAEHGGARAKQLYSTLCVRGPFRQVETRVFTRLLRQLGEKDVGLIEQAPDGVLLLGPQGEQLVEHYSFYAVFQTPEEFKISNNGKTLGTLPVQMILAPDMTIVFCGRRWRITAIHDRDKVIEVVADRTGRPPRFGGGGGLIHDKVVEKMGKVLRGTKMPAYLDRRAARMLENARSQLFRLGLCDGQVYRINEKNCLITTWAGTIKTSTLALVLQAKGYKTSTYDGFIDVSMGEGSQPIETTLQQISRSANTLEDRVLTGEENFIVDKYDRYLGIDLLRKNAMSSRIDLGAMPALAKRIIGGEG